MQKSNERGEAIALRLAEMCEFIKVTGPDSVQRWWKNEEKSGCHSAGYAWMKA